jgi:hypothetical protein
MKPSTKLIDRLGLEDVVEYVIDLALIVFFIAVLIARS